MVANMTDIVQPFCKVFLIWLVSYFHHILSGHGMQVVTVNTFSPVLKDFEIYPSLKVKHICHSIELPQSGWAAQRCLC